MTIDNIHHIRCPICGGRLFDVITGKGENSYFGTNFAVMIKCWKCRETITLKPLNNINYLVPAIHSQISISLRFDSEQENQNGGIKNEQKHSKCL